MFATIVQYCKILTGHGLALDWIFPKVCLGCQEVVQETGLCPVCWGCLQWICYPFSFDLQQKTSRDLCEICSEPLGQEGNRQGLCFSCKGDLPIFNTHRALWRYNPLSRKLIFSFKHGGQRYMARWFGKILSFLALDFPVDAIVAVPLHPKRLRRRGFNQADLLAHALSRETTLPYWPKALVRIRDTGYQGGRSVGQRYDNVDQAFLAEMPLGLADQKRSVLLVDDVYTTGATLNACAAALKEAGIHQVHVLTLSKVVR